MATKYGRSNGSFHRVLACSAGGPGFDSRLRRLVASVLPMLYAEDVGGPGQAPTRSAIIGLAVET